MYRYLLAWGGWGWDTDSGCGLVFESWYWRTIVWRGGSLEEEAEEEEEYWGPCKGGGDGGLVAGT